MRKSLSILLVAGLFAGCSDQAAIEQAKVRQQFEDAVKTFSEAQQGSVPHGTKDPASQDLQVYRKAQLTKAAAELQKILEVGTDAQRTAARRLLADTDLSNAMYVARQAATASAGLASQSTKLTVMMVALDRANSRATQLDAQQTTSVVEKLHENQTEIRRRLQDFETKSTRLTATVTDLKSKIAALHDQSQAAAKDARSLYDKAFASKGDDQSKLYTDSDAQQRKADSADADARRLSVDLDIASSELAIVDKQVALAKDADKSVQEQIDQDGDRQKQLGQARDEAVARKNEAAEKLEKQFLEIAKNHDAKVIDQFEAAQKMADRAVDVLTKGVDKAQGADKRTLQADLLGAHVTRAYILTQHAMAADSYAKLMDGLATQAKRLLPSKTLFAETARHADDSLSTIIGQGTQGTGAGLGVASALITTNASDEAFLARAKAGQDQLNKYSTLITNIQAEGPAAPPATE